MISLYLWYPRSSLLQVPGDIKDTVHVEPAVTVRLDNIERMVGKEMKAGQAAPQWPALQVNGVPEAGGTKAGGQAEQHLGASSRVGFRSRSPSVKRSAEEAELNATVPAEESAWRDVVRKNQGRKQRPVQQGTAKVNIAGGEAL